MDTSIGKGLLPMRPLTVGEVLDAALVLLRTRARALLGLGLVLAAAEQAVLVPLRQAARMDWDYLPREGHVAQWLLVVGGGFAMEAFAIAVLGGVAAGAVLPALLGRAVPRTRRSRLAMAGSVATVAVVAGLVCGLGALAVLPWYVLYPAVGLAAPAVVVDRKGPAGALWRSVKLLFKAGLRPGGIRVVGYFGWLFFRFALGAGVGTLLTLLPIDIGGPADLLAVLPWLLVNALAYPVLGCLDAVLHLETRIRTEGLDIALARALRRNEPLAPALAVP